MSDFNHLTPHEKRRVLAVKHGVIGKEGKPCTRITIAAPEMRHVTDAGDWQLRIGHASPAQRRANACAITQWRDSFAERVLTNPAVTAVTWVLLILAAAYGAAA